jgi:hypothetical protein
MVMPCGGGCVYVVHWPLVGVAASQFYTLIVDLVTCLVYDCSINQRQQGGNMFIYTTEHVSGPFKAEASTKHGIITLFINDNFNYINMTLAEAKQLSYEIHTAIMEMEHA